MDNAPNSRADLPLIGPHRCSSMAHHIARLIFATIEVAAERNGGVVTAEQVSKLRRAFVDSNAQLSATYESNFNACMACLDQESRPVFRKQQLVRFYIAALTRDALQRIALSRPGPIQKQWTDLICRAVAARIGDCAGDAVDDALADAYYRLGRETKGDLKASDLIGDSRALDVISDLLARVRAHHESRPEFAVELCRLINENIDEQITEPSRSYAVSVYDTRALLEALLAPAGSTDWPGEPGTASSSGADAA